MATLPFPWMPGVTVPWHQSITWLSLPLSCTLVLVSSGGGYTLREQPGKAWRTVAIAPPEGHVNCQLTA